MHNATLVIFSCIPLITCSLSSYEFFSPKNLVYTHSTFQTPSTKLFFSSILKHFGFHWNFFYIFGTHGTPWVCVIHFWGNFWKIFKTKNFGSVLRNGRTDTIVFVFCPLLKISLGIQYLNIYNEWKIMEKDRVEFSL